MRTPALAAALTLLLVAPAFAVDLTHYKITKPAAKPCDIQVARVYQDGPTGPVHVALHNIGPYLSTGKLAVATKVGTSLVMDGTDFTLEPGGYKDYIGSKNPRGTVEGQNISLSFQSCTVAMH